MHVPSPAAKLIVAQLQEAKEKAPAIYKFGRGNLSSCKNSF